MMKISELINKLQTLKDLHGDLHVETYWDWINADEFLLRYLNGGLSDDANPN